MGGVRRRIGRREGVKGYVTDQLLTRAEKVSLQLIIRNNGHYRVIHHVTALQDKAVCLKCVNPALISVRRTEEMPYISSVMVTMRSLTQVVVENANWEGLRDKGSALLRHLQNVTTISIVMPHQTALMIRVSKNI